MEIVAIKGLLILTLLAGGFATAVRAEEKEEPYAAHSNEALTALAADWDSLDVHQRRALLTEFRQRMAQRGVQSSEIFRIRSERRYGRIVRQADGRVIRIETQVVHVRSATAAEVLAGRPGGFGVGFERRAGAPSTEGTKVEFIGADERQVGDHLLPPSVSPPVSAVRSVPVTVPSRTVQPAQQSEP